MGWDYQYSWKTKQDVVEDLAKSFVSETGEDVMCLEHSLKGNCLWMVFERNKKDGTKERVINLALLRKDRKDNCYGYKGMAEVEHPYYYSCPKKYLDMVPVASQEWRDRVMGKTPA